MPDRDLLQELLDYDPETGELRWRERSVSYFKSWKLCQSWNRQWAGKLALTAVSGRGYKHGKIMMQPQLAHRVIWVMMTGEDPEQVAHLNGDTRDNRWANLARDTHIRTLTDACYAAARRPRPGRAVAAAMRKSTPRP